MIKKAALGQFLSGNPYPNGLTDGLFYREKMRAIHRVAPRQLGAEGAAARILEVGGGRSGLARMLYPAAEVITLDVDHTLHRQSPPGAASRFVCGDARRLPFVDGFFDAVTLFDVLEHVDDDRGLVRLYADKVPSGAHFLVTVPAFRFLWSGHDIFLEHKRRYRLPKIERAMRDAGLEVAHGAYYFGAIFPLAATIRLLTRRSPEPKSSLKRHNALTNGVLTLACTAELPFFPVNRLAGLSAFVLAKKP